MVIDRKYTFFVLNKIKGYSYKIEENKTILCQHIYNDDGFYK